MEFQIIDWRYHEVASYDIEEGKHEDGEKQYVIDMYGRTMNRKSVYVRVVDYTPFFYVEVPNTWNKIMVDIFIKHIKSLVYYKIKDSLSSYVLVQRNKLYGFTDYKKFQFVRLIFKNYKGFKAYERVLGNPIINKRLSLKPQKYRIYESNIEPFLRCMHIRDLDACGWVNIDDSKFTDITDKPTICDINIETKWTNINKINKTAIAPFIIASFDIECTSGDGSFPQAIRDEDKVIQIGTTFNRYGETECYYHHIVTLRSCDPIDGVDVESFEDERDVLIAWTKMLQRENPDIMTGYNIFGFDYKYLHDRSKKLGCNSKFSKLCKTNNNTTQFVEKQLASSALGDNRLYYYDMKGRVQIDLMKNIQKDFKLSSYKLDAVAAYFIRENIQSIDIKKNPYREYSNEEFISIINTKNTYGLKEQQYISIYYNDGLSDNKYLDGKKFHVINLTDKTITILGSLDSEEMKTSNFKSYWCQAKDDVTPQDIFKLQEGDAKDRAIVAKYCIQDSVLCNKLINKLQIITNNVGMANVCNVPLSYLFLRGQGVKIFSLVSKKCRLENHLIPVVKKQYTDNDKDKKEKPISKIEEQLKNMGFDINENEDDDGDEGYEGATVFPPDAGVHFCPIEVLDYASLYPRSMIHRNLSHECIITDDIYDNLDGYVYRNAIYINKMKEPVICRYAQKKDGTLGIIPKILQDLLDARTATKKLLKQEQDPFKKSILDGLQLAYKITANSLYGQIGAPTSPIYYKHIAASTTATGREMLTFAKEFNETMFYRLVELIQKKKFKSYTELLNNLFDGKILDLNITPEFSKLLTDAPDLIVTVSNEKCIDKSLNITSKKDFIKYFKTTIQEILGPYKIKPKVIYGDSVVENTPVVIKLNGHIKVDVISNICSNGSKWTDYGDGKKECSLNKLMIWTEAGWTKVNRIIKHETTKKIFRIVTHSGCVDVTEDHSLITHDGIKVSPLDCHIGTSLLQSCPIINTIYNNISEEEAWAMGFFMANGTCGFTNVNHLIKYYWSINCTNNNHLIEAKIKLNKVESCMFKLLVSMNGSNIHKLVPYDDDSVKHMFFKYSELLYYNGQSKIRIVPNKILQSSINVQEAFWKGYYIANENNHTPEYVCCNCVNQITVQTLYILLNNIGYNVTINLTDHVNIFKLTGTKFNNGKLLNIIKRIEDVTSEYYYNGKNKITVYDLETDNHHFQAGIGNIIVHNTDSVFLNMNMYDPKTEEVFKNQMALEKGIKLGVLAGQLINKFMPYPHDLEYEKTFWPFCILTKKRYVGNLYEYDPTSYEQKSMGIVLKRRDNAQIVKIICGGIIRSILRDKSAEKAVEFTKQGLYDILSEKYTMDKFILTKTLRSDYKKRWTITHAVLADRIAERDPGNKPQSNDRIPYAFIITKKEVKLQGDRVETPDYIIENNLHLDYLYYIVKQIMKPSIQFLTLLIENPERIFKHFIIMEENRISGKRPVEYYFNNTNNDDNNDNNNSKGINCDIDDPDDDLILYDLKNKKKLDYKPKNSKAIKKNSKTSSKVNFDFDVELDKQGKGFVLEI